jgi:hypothetical protein
MNDAPPSIFLLFIAHDGLTSDDIYLEGELAYTATLS